MHIYIQIAHTHRYIHTYYTRKHITHIRTYMHAHIHTQNLAHLITNFFECAWIQESSGTSRACSRKKTKLDLKKMYKIHIHIYTHAICKHPHTCFHFFSSTYKKFFIHIPNKYTSKILRVSLRISPALHVYLNINYIDTSKNKYITYFTNILQISSTLHVYLNINYNDTLKIIFITDIPQKSCAPHYQYPRICLDSASSTQKTFARSPAWCRSPSSTAV